MRKYNIVFLLFLLSCNTISSKKQNPEKTLAEKKRYDYLLDSMRTALDENVSESLSDTAGIYLAPVKVFNAKFVRREYSNYKSVSLSYKNVSNKTIEAIRFRWYGENAFGEPADAGGMIDGIGGGVTDDALKPGQTKTSTWSILSRDGKKVLRAWAYEVVFSDGTKWKFKPSK